ncbi:phospholipase-like, aminotransferase-like mobile domain protein [Tanacetum coccineum]|uniref:Phospholipase-like, aminotransferase-like mobile domain protein n=1 Tax=Tanacetum coccineum TaxID=301880 RepID=A0ABQ5EVP4_9ASTR
MFNLPRSSINAYLNDWDGRGWALLAGFLFGFGNGLQFMGGQAASYAAGDAVQIGYDVKIIDLFALFDDEEKFSKLSDADAIRLCLLLSLEIIFMGRELVSVVDDVYLRMVNDLDAWNSFLRIWINGSLLARTQIVGGQVPGKSIPRSFVMAVKERHDLECICETLLTLPKEVKSLRGRIHKLESIIQSTFYPSRVVEKQETLKIDLQSTSEDEPDIKDYTSPKQHYKYTYSSKQEDQIIQLVDQRQQDHISNMIEVSEQKIQSEIQRLYNHREARLNKIAEEDKQRKCLRDLNPYDTDVGIERCVPKKRKYVDVLRSSFCALPKISNVPSIVIDGSNQNNVLNHYDEKCKLSNLD